MEDIYRYGIGQTVRALRDDPNRSFEECAGIIQQVTEELTKKGLYCYENYTEFGSSPSARVIMPHNEAGSRECILWCINHYLGLNRHPDVIKKVIDVTQKFGTGCGTSAMSGGLNALHREIEQKISAMVGKERALLFSTGYTANLGSISTLLGKNDVIIFDREAHASIIDGVRLSGKKWFPFRHNNLKDLRNKLEYCSKRFDKALVVVESAYSMSGDLSPLKEIAALKEQYNFYLYVDEAHTFGFYGDKGRGYCYEQGVTDTVDFIMSTLSKATASMGGFVAMKKEFMTLLKLSSNAYIFQAAFTPQDAGAVIGALDVIANDPEPARTLHKKNRYMRQRLTECGFNLGESKSPVIPVFIPDVEKLNTCWAELYAKGIFTVVITYPAVKKTEGRFRFIVNASHTYEQIDKTVDALSELNKKYALN
jgi:glycine C-acetyltransferase